MSEARIKAMNREAQLCQGEGESELPLLHFKAESLLPRIYGTQRPSCPAGKELEVL